MLCLRWWDRIKAAILCLLIYTLETTGTDVVEARDADLTDELHQQLLLHRYKRIIGGSEVLTGQYPQLVGVRGHIPLRFFNAFAVAYEDVYCGGTILNNRWIATAAHCFSIPGISTADLMNPRNWYIKAGDNRISFTLPQRLCAIWNSIRKTNNIHCWYVPVSKVILHPQFSVQENYFNDIALIKLAFELPSSAVDPSVAAVKLPSPSLTTAWPRPGVNCTVAGWGCSVEGGSIQSVARSLMLPIVSDAECGQLIQPAIGPSRLCAGYLNQNMGICKGDSGSPLICYDSTSKSWMLAGIASSTSSAVPAQVPGVFTRVSYYFAWLNATISTN